MTRSTFTHFATALAIGAAVLATSTAANARGSGHGYSSGPVVRDHRTPMPVSSPVVRDHRSPGPIVRDHRTPVPVVVRDHRGPYGAPQGGVTVTGGMSRGRGATRACLGGYCVPVPGRLF